MSEIADDMVMRADEVLALRPDALLLRRTHSGTYRTGGGAYERPFIHLMIFGPDGLETRCEYFDVDRADDALARFDEVMEAVLLGTQAVTDRANTRGRT